MSVKKFKSKKTAKLLLFLMAWQILIPGFINAQQMMSQGKQEQQPSLYLMSNTPSVSNQKIVPEAGFSQDNLSEEIISQKKDNRLMETEEEKENISEKEEGKKPKKNIRKFVRILGAVSNPGKVERTKDMRLSDLIAKGEGFLPEAYPKEGVLVKFDERFFSTSVSLVDLELVNKKVPEANVILNDRDTFFVYTWDEIGWEPRKEGEVKISGAVSRPGKYIRTNEMRIDDLLKQAGGLLPEAFSWRGVLIRRDARFHPVEAVLIDLNQAMQGNTEEDLKLKDGDSLFIYTTEEFTGKSGSELKIIKKKETVPVFGMSFFEPARKRIRAIEENIIKGGKLSPPSSRNARNGMVGPLEMVTGEVIATPPAQYILSEGDKLNLYFWGDFIDLKSLLLSIEEDGMASIPGAGRIMARGLSLEQFENAVRTELLRKATTKNLNLIVTLERLKTIQVYITGAAYRPGAYAISSLSTIFNALNASGGPMDYGSLRTIKLLRDNKETEVDFYKYLLNGDSSLDLLLRGGDTIYIRPAERLIEVSGEVKRPAVYELKEGEGINELLKICGGLTAKGVNKKIILETVTPHQELILKDIDLTLEDQKITLQDGDVITVLPLPTQRKNMVTLEGKVLFPGEYELKKGMTVKDLFNPPNAVLGEADQENVYILRWNQDQRTTKLIPLNLEKALKGDTGHNIALEELDRLLIYSKWETKWLPLRIVKIMGAVSRPGNVDRSDEMRLSDLIIKGGGLLPDADTSKGLLVRMDERFFPAESVVIDLAKAIKGDLTANLKLRDGDSLMIYKWEETAWKPKREVIIQGSVQRVGKYTRTNDMRLKDLFFQAGGLLPEASPKGYLAHARGQGKTDIEIIDLEKLYQPESEENRLLKDGDFIFVPAKSEFINIPRFVTVEGEVKYPGIYALKTKGDTISEIIERAGGLTAQAYIKGSIFKRNIPFNTEQKRDFQIISDLTNFLNNLEYKRSLARALWLEKIQATELISSTKGVSAGANISGTAGEAASLEASRQAGVLAGEAIGQTLEALAPTLPLSVVSPPRRVNESIPGERIVINLDLMLNNKYTAKDMILKDGDTLIIPPHPYIVSVTGAVIKASNFTYNREMRLNDYVGVTGGYTEDADLENILVNRMDGSIFRTTYGKNIKIEEGDIIYLPTKVMKTEIVDRWDKVISAIKFVTVTVSTMVVTVFLIRELKK